MHIIIQGDYYMCTALTFNAENFYFGRNFDYHFSFGEEVAVVPRYFPLDFRKISSQEKHFAMIGMAHIKGNTPLFYDAVNEKGLCMAALNFVGNAQYKKYIKDKINIAHFEFIPFILGKCATVLEAEKLIKDINITDEKFNDELPLAQLHWIISDNKKSITVEAVKEGIKIYENKVGVLTNNPHFPMQLFGLNNYMKLSNKNPKNTFSKEIKLDNYSLGMGTMGLPGDLSSSSRFVRTVFAKLNSPKMKSEKECVNQFFHILGFAEQVLGCNDIGNNEFEITVYSSCINADKGIYYYKTYDDFTVKQIEMNNENLESDILFRYLI